MNGAPRVDLHVHTRYSDGTAAPAEAVAAAAALGLRAMAVTDHDTVAGVAEAAAAGRQAGLAVIPGVELSCDILAEGRLSEAHVLGLGLGGGAAADPLWARLEERRARRLGAMLARMAESDFPELPPSCLPVPLGVAGRPHVARAMVQAGFVRTEAEAFAKYLHDGGPLHVSSARLPYGEAVSFIHGQGGIALLAHPGLDHEGQGWVDWLEAGWPAGERQGPSGLDGVEAYHPSCGPELTGRLLAFARARGAAVSGGSDWHGGGSGGRGRTLGQPPVPASVLDTWPRRP